MEANNSMRTARLRFVFSLILFSSIAQAQQTCCFRDVATTPIGESGLDWTFESVIHRDSTRSDCHEYDIMSIRGQEELRRLDDAIGSLYGAEPDPEAQRIFSELLHLDYLFRGDLIVTEGADDSGQYTLHMRFVDHQRGQIVKEGSASSTGFKGGGSEALETLAASFLPLDELMYDYERIPETASVDPEENQIMAGKKMTIHVRDIVDNESRNSEPWQRILVKVEKGEILNGTPQDGYRVFEVGDGAIDLIYRAPEDCENQTETITIHNSCTNDFRTNVNFIPEREIVSEKFDVLCDRWEGIITYTEQVSGFYLERKVNRLYTMTIKATLNLKEASEGQILYESDDAYVDVHDSFQQTGLGGLQESWNASKKGRVPVKVSLEFSPKEKDDPSDLSLYNIAFGEWDAMPVIYTYKSKIPLFGQDCKGRSELTHGALYMLEDMTAERCTYKDKQTLLTGDYSWNDPIATSVDPKPWDCPDRMGIPVGIPNMIYHKHLDWKIRRLSR